MTVNVAERDTPFSDAPMVAVTDEETDDVLTVKFAAVAPAGIVTLDGIDVIKFGLSLVSKLVDRLQAQGLVERDRVEEDRRLSIARITKKGLRLLEQMQPQISEEHQSFSRKVSRRDCLELSRICETIYDEA